MVFEEELAGIRGARTAVMLHDAPSTMTLRLLSQG